MNIIGNYCKQVITHDLLNKFNYKTVKQIPKIKKITLNFNCKSFDLKKLAIAMLALELISTQKSAFTRAKKPSVNLKIRKGHPVGCKVILEKKNAEIFLFYVLNTIFPELKNFKGLKHKNTKNRNFCSFSITDLINFNELNSNFYLFANLPALNITLRYSTNKVNELNFLNNSLKIPLL